MAGPVIAAVVLFDSSADAIVGLNDSKRLSAARREELAALIKVRSAWAIGRADAGEVDRLNVLEASMLAMVRACRSLPGMPERALVDGNRLPALGWPVEAIVRGDASVPEIMAASILAKVARDREMTLLDALYPQYGFAQHKGYPTRAHQDSLRAWGPCPLHRMSFLPVRQAAGTYSAGPAEGGQR